MHLRTKLYSFIDFIKALFITWILSEETSIPSVSKVLSSFSPLFAMDNSLGLIAPGAVVVDAGTASEGGKLVGDVSPEVLARKDLAAVTPAVGGVEPLTVAVLFDDVLRAAKG